MCLKTNTQKRKQKGITYFDFSKLFHSKKHAFIIGFVVSQSTS